MINMDFSILVLDDEEEIGKAIELILSDYKIHSFTKISAVRSYMEQNEVSLLIIDFDLNQEKTGIEVAQEMKSLYPLLQIILFTGNTEYVIIKNALNSGAISSFMNKPISNKELKNLVIENKKIWENNQLKLHEIIEKIKNNSVSDDDFKQFGNELPILNLLIKESIRIKESNVAQIIGINISRLGDIIMQEFLKNDMIIYNDMLFLGFITTVNKFGGQMFDSGDTLNVVRLNVIDLINLQIKETNFTIFMIRYTTEYDEDILSLFNNIHNMLIENDFNTSCQKEKVIEFLNNFNNEIRVLK